MHNVKGHVPQDKSRRKCATSATRANTKNYASKSSAGRKRLFANEELLQGAIIELLQRMPGISDVQLLQGALENGKDIVFRTAGPLDEPITHACVVKNHGLTGQVSASKSILTVTRQAQQALTTAYFGSDGLPVRVNHVFIITPETISQNAMTAIHGELRERAGQINFIGGEELIRLFQKHWPDYLAEQPELLASYSERLARDLEYGDDIQRVAHHYPSLSLNSMKLGGRIQTGFSATLILPSLTSYGLRWGLMPDLYSDVTTIQMESWRSDIEASVEILRHLQVWGLVSVDNVEKYELCCGYALAVLRECWTHGRVVQTSIQEVRQSQQICETRRLDAPGNAVVSLDDIRQQFSASVSAIDHDVSRAPKQEVNPEKIICESKENTEFLKCLYATDCIHALGRRSIPPSSDFDEHRSWEVREDQLCELAGLFMVVAPPGYGKTSYCRWAALEDLRRWRNGSEKRLPIYVRLATIADSLSADDWDILSLGVHTALLTANDWQIVKSGKAPLKIYFDGLDELATDGLRKQLIEYARRMSDLHRTWQIIVTSRDYLRPAYFRNVTRLHLKGFEMDAVRAMARRCLSGSSITADRFVKELENNTGLAALAKVPLLCTLMIHVFEITGDLPSRRAALYSTFVDLLCGGWDLVRRVRRESRFGSETKLAVLTRLAADAHGKKMRVIPFESFHHAALESVPGVLSIGDASDRRIAAERLLEELRADGLLVASKHQVEFSHLSFQEFLFARSLVGRPMAGRVDNTISAFLDGDDWWREAILFYLSLCSDPERLLTWLSSPALAGDGTTGAVRRLRQEFLVSRLRETFPETLGSRCRG